MRQGIVGILLLVLSATAFPDSIAYNFTGSLSTSSVGFDPDATVAGTISFPDNDDSFSFNMGTRTVYAAGELSYTVVNPVLVDDVMVDQLITGSLGSSGPAVQINNDSSGIGDQFSIFGGAANDAGDVDGFEPDFLRFVLTDPAGEAISSLSLASLLPLVLDDYGVDFRTLTFERDGDSIASFRIETLTQVPLPAAAWLFLSALSGLVMMRRRNRLSKSPKVLRNASRELKALPV